MDFLSLKFASLAIVSVFIFYILDYKYRVGFLALLSCGFIATYSYFLLIHIVIYTAINYYLGIKIPDSKHKIALYRVGIILNILQLVVLKYASFAIDPVFQLFNVSSNISKLSEIIIPIGISYFTLQGIGYLINIKMGWEKPEKKFLNFLLYITFFPKFLSGPVERSNHFLPQLIKNQLFNVQQVSAGFRIALFGVFKKVAIANQLAPYITDAFNNLNAADGYSLWLLLFLLPLYLYFDFSGYTDIAIGLARAFGIELLPNFNRPFFSENVTVFWKRFHMSLSAWFNDYVFRQTSFRYRRWGIFASTYAVFLTFTLFGIWHGAGWNFMILGLLQALAINYEFFTKRIRLRLFSGIPKLLVIWFGRLLTYSFYCVSLVFFFSPDINSVFIYFTRLFEVSGPVKFEPVSTYPITLIIYIPVFLLLELIQNDYGDTSVKLENFWTGENAGSRYFRWTIYCLILTMLFVVGGDVQQFVYVNF